MSLIRSLALVVLVVPFVSFAEADNERCSCNALAGNYPGVVLYLNTAQPPAPLRRFSAYPPTYLTLLKAFHLCEEVKGTLEELEVCR